MTALEIDKLKKRQRDMRDRAKHIERYRKYQRKYHRRWNRDRKLLALRLAS